MKRSAQHEAAVAVHEDIAAPLTNDALSLVRIIVTLGAALGLTAGVMAAVDIVLARIS